MLQSATFETLWQLVDTFPNLRLSHPNITPKALRSKMSDSIWDDPTVTAYILGELSTEETDAFEKRMQADTGLAEVVAEARSVTEQLQIMYAQDASKTLDPTRRNTITAGHSLAAEKSPSKPVSNSQMRWRIPLALLATAAALLLLLGSPYLFTPERTVSSESANSSSKDSRNSDRSRGVGASESEMMNGAGSAQQNASMPTAAKAQLEEMVSPALDSFAQSGEDQQMDMLMDEDSDTEAGFGMGAGLPGGIADKGIANGQEGISVEQLRSKSIPRLKTERSLPQAPGAVPAAAVTPAAVTPVAPAPTTAPTKALNARRSDPFAEAERRRESATFMIPNAQDADEIPEDRNRFENISENAFKRVSDSPLSTFSVDVDTASYSKVREYLLSQRRRPPVDAVRVEELVNYFNYEYLPPKDDAEHPFVAKADIIGCPWNEDHRLARIALKGKTMQPKNRPLSNLVFLLDTSGSMNSPNKLPLVKSGMNMLLSQLGENDRVAIVVYAGSAGLVLDSTPATKTRKIEKALNTLAAGGSTNGGQGIQLAYQTARDNFIDGGVNRVILCTDGDFNVGTTGTGDLVRMVEKEAAGNIFLSVLGFGMGNHNDSMLEQISGIGNGNYAFIDGLKEAQKVLVDQASGTLVTIAKDVKLQIEFNPRMVSAYRLIGYENRVLAKEDFNNDKKDAGEIGAGHAVTALYELVPTGGSNDSTPPRVDDLKYQEPNKLTDAAKGGESLTIKLRYKQPDGDTSKLVEFPVVDNETSFDDADHDARFAAAVASFGMQLRDSDYAGDWDMQNVINVAKDAKGEDISGLRDEFVEMAKAAKKLTQ